MILECHATNLLFKTPPATNLVTGEGLGKIEVNIGDANDAAWASQLKLAFGVADVSDCFRRMVLDRGMSEYFCWPPVLAFVPCAVQRALESACLRAASRAAVLLASVRRRALVPAASAHCLKHERAPVTQAPTV